MKLMCDGWSSDGVMSILIKTGKKVFNYEYVVDTALIPGWKKRMPYEPGIVLNEIKTNSKAYKRVY